LLLQRLALGSLFVCFAVTPVGICGAAEETILFSTLRPANWDIFLADRSGAKPRRLTTDPALDYNAVFSPDGRWIVFTSERGASPDLYIFDAKKLGTPRQLTSHPAMEDAATFSPDGKTLAFVSTRSGRANIWTVPFADGKVDESRARNLTPNDSGFFNPVFSPDGLHIAFSSDRHDTSASDVYVMDAGGESIRRLTDSGGYDGSPAWSSDGRYVYYYSSASGRRRIHRVSLDGKQRQQVKQTAGGLSPAIDSDGRLAFSANRGGRSRILATDPDGGDVKTVVSADTDLWAPDFDPTGSRIVCHGVGPAPVKNPFDSGTPGPFLVNAKRTVKLPDRLVRPVAIRGYLPAIDTQSRRVISGEGFHRLVISDFDGGHRRTLHEDDDTHTWSPAFGPEGRFAVFAVGRSFAGTFSKVDLYRKPIGDGKAENLTSKVDGNNALPDVSPDGRRIVFRSGRDGNFEIYLLELEGGKLQRLTDDAAADTMPAFSPDGSTVAFSSRRSGDYEIYFLSLTGEGKPGKLTRVTHTPGRDMHPKFSPDGRWLLFASARGGMNDERPLLHAFNPQPYGEVFVRRIRDGRTLRLTHNKWEDGPGAWSKAPFARRD